MVLEWAESYQISVALRLGGLDVLEEGVGGGARRGEAKIIKLKIFIGNKSKKKKKKKREEEEEDFLTFTTALYLQNKNSKL